MHSIDDLRPARHLHPLLIATLAVLLVPALARAGQEAPGVPTRLRVLKVEGPVVSLSWAAPADGPAPTGYILTGGFRPSEALAAVPMPGPGTRFTFAAPTGEFYIRVHAVTGEVVGPPGEDIPLRVGLPAAPPAAPRQLTAMVGVGTVALSWRNPYDAGIPDSMLLHVEGVLNGTIPLPMDQTTAFGGVPAGRYTLWMTAVNQYGESEPSNTVDIVVESAIASAVELVGAGDVAVRYQPFDTPRLAELAERERLEEVTAGSASEWERIRRVADWVAAQWVEGFPDPYPPWDAMTILDWIRDGTTGGYCGQRSQVFLQALASLGYTARYMEVGPPDNPYNHFTTEVWSNEYDKWVMLDADFNLYFARDGVPLSAIEIHDALLAGEAHQLDVVHGRVRDGISYAEGWPLRTAELYYYVRVQLKADHLSAPNETAFDRFNGMVEWEDDRVVPWERSAVESSYTKELLTRRRTRDRRVFDAPLNRVVLVAAGEMPHGRMRLEVTDSMLQRSHYEVREVHADGSHGEWRVELAPEILVDLSPTSTALEVRAVNIRAVAGPVLTLTVSQP